MATARRGAGGCSLASSLLLILHERTFGLWKVRGSEKAGAEAESRPGSVCLGSLSGVTARLGAPMGEGTAQGPVQSEWL